MRPAKVWESQHNGVEVWVTREEGKIVHIAVRARKTMTVRVENEDGAVEYVRPRGGGIGR